MPPNMSQRVKISDSTRKHPNPGIRGSLKIALIICLAFTAFLLGLAGSTVLKQTESLWEDTVIYRESLTPESMEELLAIKNYDSFNLGLEKGPHVAIPKGVNGNFSLHTAPFGLYPSSSGYKQY